MDIDAVKRMPDATQRTSWDIGHEPIEATKKNAKRPAEIPAEQAGDEVSRAELEQAVAEINQKLALHNTHLVFSVHDKTHAVMVKVVDADTGETVREIPPKRVLDIRAMTLEELGLLVDEQA